MGDEKESVYLFSYGIYASGIIENKEIKLGMSYYDFYPAVSEKEVQIRFETDKPLLKKKLNMIGIGGGIGKRDQYLKLENITKVEIPNYELILKKIK